jgi:uncharacterized protein YjbJ (UPF0337 family)
MGILALAQLTRRAHVRRSSGTPFSSSLTRLKEKPMKASTNDKAKGKLREVEGSLKEAVGAAAGDRDLRVKGKIEKGAGKVQGAVGRVEKAVGK